MSIEQNLREMEISREAYWRRYPGTSPFKLRRRALTVRHCLHVLPGDRILEIGAGSGLWSEQLTAVLRGENPITAAVFNDELSRTASAKRLPNTEFVHVTDLAADLPTGAFDQVVGTVIANRGLHALINLLLPARVRDVSNNLKLYRAEILKGLEIEEHHFAANVETGLKPVLSGYDIEEVPISWINRTPAMGSSTFKLFRVGPGYVSALARTMWDFWRGRRSFIERTASGDGEPHALPDTDVRRRSLDVQ